MTQEGKTNVKRELPGWVGIILLVYGGITLATSYWSPEAYQTAGLTTIYTSAAAAVIGIILVLFWLATRTRK